MPMDHLDRFLAAFIQALAQSAPYLVVGYLIAAVIREYVPVATMARWFSARGVRPVLTATGIGCLLPMCSCTVLPLGIGMVKGGAARGTILSFLITAPALSPVAVLLCLSLMGGTFTVLYVTTCVSGALIAGFIGNALLRNEPPPTGEACTVDPADDRRTWGARARAAGHWAFYDLGAEISVDLVIGLLIAAAVLALLPLGWIATWLGTQHFMTLVYVIVLGLVTYTCSVPSMPVVQSLLLAGISPGAGIAFLIAGPATNLGELLALRRQLGGRTTALFTVALVVMSLTGGLIADHWVFADYHYQPSPLSGQAAGGCCVASFMGVSAKPTGTVEALGNIPWWHWP
nr:permease [Planctomycetota bacterium]